MRRKAAERAIALGDDDPFDYELALELGSSHAAVQDLGHEEYIRWRAFYAWRAIQRRHAQDVANMRANR